MFFASSFLIIPKKKLNENNRLKKAKNEFIIRPHIFIRDFAIQANIFFRFLRRYHKLVRHKIYILKLSNLQIDILSDSFWLFLLSRFKPVLCSVLQIFNVMLEFLPKIESLRVSYYLFGKIDLF